MASRNRSRRNYDQPRNSLGRFREENPGSYRYGRSYDNDRERSYSPYRNDDSGGYESRNRRYSGNDHDPYSYDRRSGGRNRGSRNGQDGYYNDNHGGYARNGGSSYYNNNGYRSGYERDDSYNDADRYQRAETRNRFDDDSYYDDNRDEWSDDYSMNDGRKSSLGGYDRDYGWQRDPWNRSQYSDRQRESYPRESYPDRKGYRNNNERENYGFSENNSYNRDWERIRNTNRAGRRTSSRGGRPSGAYSRHQQEQYY